MAEGSMPGEATPSQGLVKSVRLHCMSKGAFVRPDTDGVLALAAISSGRKSATLLLADMSLWGRRPPSALSLIDGIDDYMRAAYRIMIAAEGILLNEVRIVEWRPTTVGERFDFFHTGEGGFFTHSAVPALRRSVADGSREALLMWLGQVGHRLLGRAEMVVDVRQAG